MLSKILNKISKTIICTSLSHKKKMYKISDDFDQRCKKSCRQELGITKTRLYNIDPLKPHIYIVKLGFTGVYIIFLISAQKHRLWVLVRTASVRRF